MTQRFFLAALLAILLWGLLACGYNRERVSETHIVEVKPDLPLRATLWSERRQYVEGETVHLRFILENLSDQELVLEDADEPVVDIHVLDWFRWSEEQGAEQDLSRLVLPPHERYEINWFLPPLQQGGYFVNGTWVGRPRDLATISFCYGPMACP
jgi:hypothetical protein